MDNIYDNIIKEIKDYAEPEKQYCYSNNTLYKATEEENIKMRSIIETFNLKQETLNIMLICGLLKHYDIDIIEKLILLGADIDIEIEIEYLEEKLNCFNSITFAIKYNNSNDCDKYITLLLNTIKDMHKLHLIKKYITPALLEEFTSNQLIRTLIYCNKYNIKLFDNPKKTNNDDFFNDDKNLNSLFGYLLSDCRYASMYYLIKYTIKYMIINDEIFNDDNYNYMLNDLWNHERTREDAFDDYNCPYIDEIYKCLYILASLGLKYDDGLKLRKLYL